MGELIKNFGIDWKLLIAQAVNFLILFFLLKKFAYKPILDALRKRKEDIEKGIQFSKDAEEKVKKIEIIKEETLGRAREDALGIVTSAQESGKKQREEIIQEAHRRVDIVVDDAKKLIDQEKAKMDERVYKDAKALVRAGIIKALGKMPPEVRDEALIEEALRELKDSKKYSEAK